MSRTLLAFDWNVKDRDTILNVGIEVVCEVTVNLGGCVVHKTIMPYP